MSRDPAAQVAMAAPDPSGPEAEIDRWIHASAARSGVGRVDTITEVHATPWSTVLAVIGDGTRLYFKAVWPAQRHEAAATARIAAYSPNHMAPVVAVDEARGWMLLADAGEPLKRREVADQLTLLPEAARRYAELQIGSMPRVDELLSLGVPDRRDLGAHLDRLVAGYPSGRDDTLTTAELAALRDLSREVGPMERHLAAIVPASVEHGDLHPGNILADADRVTRVFDWGDVSIASPFLSLAVLLGSLEESLGLLPGDPALDSIIEGYLGPFGALAVTDGADALLRDARLLGSISRAVTWDHVATHVPPEDRLTFPDPVAASLRDCLRIAAS